MTVSGTQGTAGESRGEAWPDLLRRAAALSRAWETAGGTGARPDGAATDQVLRELADAEGAADEAQRRALRTARGVLLAVRHLAGGAEGSHAGTDDGAEESHAGARADGGAGGAGGAGGDRGGRPGGGAGDRAEALVLLREAREVVAVTEEQTRGRTAVTKLLIRLLVPRSPNLAFRGRQDVIDVLTVGATFAAADSSALREDLAEVAVLLEELAETADPAAHAELERWTSLLRLMQTARDRDSLLELGAHAAAFGGMPPQIMTFMTAAMEMLKGLPDSAPVTMEVPAQDVRQQVELAADGLLPMMELFAPGILRPEELAQAVEELPQGSWQERTTAGVARLGMAMRTGDPEGLVAAARPLLRAEEDQDVPAGLAAILQAALLTGASMSGGNLADAAAARRLLTETLEPADVTDGMTSSPAGRDLVGAGRALLEYQRICETPEDDLDALDDIGERLLDMRQELTEGTATSIVLFVLGVLQLRRAQAIGRAGRAVGPPVRRALMYLRESQEHPDLPVALRGMVAPVGAMCKALEQIIDPSGGSLLEEVEQVRASLGGPSVVADQDIRSRLGMALVLDIEYDRRGDPAVLAAALRELETARAEIGENTACATAQDVYRRLADHYRRRAADGDTERALEATERLLEKVTEDVLLQIGAEHGLEAARAAADRGVAAAGWAAGTGDAATALRVLEAGRALVLRAVAASASVPEQLEAHGEHELAAQWRNAARAGADADTDTGVARTGVGPGAGEGAAVVRTDADAEAEADAAVARMGADTDADTDTGVVRADADSLIPSTLRRRALRALGTAGISIGPAWQEVADAAQAAGVDAVVHLLVGQGDGPGWALVVRPGSAPLPLELPGLARQERAPLERYLDAARDRSVVTAPGVPRSAPAYADAVAAWKTALRELCDWAGPAVMGPVLDVVRPGRPARPEDPVRLVLLPAGNLGSVPWHAARLDARVGERPAHVVDHAVVSYAASGAEFVRSAARTRLPVAAAPVLVADPRSTLAYAEHEVEALRNAFYRDARCYGYLSRNGFHRDGTPDELLPLLPGGTAERPATLVEFSVHGLAGGRPTVSGLLLHRPREGGDDAGVLTVRRLLGAPSVGGGGAGPLVVLSACETDLSTRDHDETLTLTTAFVARGAADVIGSKWSIDDTSSAVLMYVLHHFLAEGADPALALRRAQLWALDADRPSVPGLPGPLAMRIEGKPALSVDAWAPFIHQGNPAPVRPGGTTVGHE
ncbi:CHAT domain-containing protein [Streptomyces sp. NPDC014995]|uniref:CHAT domain-containing protein n=1 Tax=Streptomyces sp. NPDC014995 TaxID=3364936 RepID=UPI0036F8FC60